MSTYKKTGPFGFDYAVPGKCPAPPAPPVAPPPPAMATPAPPVEPWEAFPFYPTCEIEPEPVPTPPVYGRPCPPPNGFRPYPVPPCPPPPYPAPKPEKVDASSKRLAKLSQKAKVLVQMIRDFEGRNKPAILTIGSNSYQFGVDMVDRAEDIKGMYSDIICAEPIQALDEMDYTVMDDNRVRLNEGVAKDLLQTELARVRQEITIVAASLNNEIRGEEFPPISDSILSTDE